MGTSRVSGVKFVARDPSPTRVFSGAEFSEGETSTLCVPTALGPSWKSIMQNSVVGWQSWELPLSRSSQFWRDSNPDPTLYAEFRNRLFVQQGTGSEVLSLIATFPENGDTWNSVSQHTYSFALWDSWLKEFGAASDFEELQGFIDAAHPPLMRRAEAGIHDNEVRSQRLNRKYPTRRTAFVASFGNLASGGAAAVGGWGLGQYVQSWRIYAQEGLPLHMRLSTICASAQTPALNDFLLCKALTEGAALWMTLAFANQQISLDARLHRQILPLLALAAMAAALFSDLYRFQRGSHSKSKSLNAAVVYDAEQAVLVHNSVFTRFFEERDAVLRLAKGMVAGKERTAVLQLVEVVEGSLAGIMAWQKFPLKFQGDVGKEIAVSLVPVVAVEMSSWIGSQLDSAVQQFVDLYIPL